MSENNILDEALSSTYCPVPNTPESYNILCKSFFVLLLRIGFILVQLACIPVENIYVIMLNNLLDIGVALLSYTLADIIGIEAAIKQGPLPCLIGSAIICTFLSARLHIIGLLLVTSTYCLFCQPVIMYMVYNEEGLLLKTKFIKDHGGIIVIHLTSSLIGLIGTLFLGRRIMKLNSIDTLSIGTDAPSKAITGYIFIIIGLAAFEFKDTSYPINYNHVIKNNLIAFATGSLTITALHFMVFRDKMFKYWVLIRTLQACLAAIVSVAAAVDIYTPLEVFGISFFSTILFFYVALSLHSTAFEDNCNIVSIHLCCGFGGIICPTLIECNYCSSIFKCLVLISITIVFISIFYIILFLLLKYCEILRSKSEKENNDNSTAILRTFKTQYLKRIFELKETEKYIEPGRIYIKYKQNVKKTQNQ